MTIRSPWITAFCVAVCSGLLGVVAVHSPVCGASPILPEGITLSPGSSRSAMVIGIAVHRERSDFDAARSDDLVRRLGFSSIRDEIGQSADNAPGGLVRSLARGGPLSSPLRSTNKANLFAITGGGSRQFQQGIPVNPSERASYYRFIAGLGQRIGADRPMLEIWNEWNLPTSLRKSGSAASYSDLVRGAVPTLRQAFPGSVILAGSIGNDFASSLGTTSYWNWTRDYLAGGSWKQADGLSVHIYANCMAGMARQPVAMIQRLMELDGMVRAANANRSFPIYVTEVGWPEQHGACGFSQAERTAFPAQFLVMAEAMPFVRGVWLYELRDGSANRADMENTFGLANPDYTIKPSTCATAEIIALLKSYRVSGVEIKGGTAIASLQSSEGSLTLAWSADGAEHRMPLPQGAHARALCSTQDAGGGPIDLTILPRIIYTGAPPAASLLQ